MPAKDIPIPPRIAKLPKDRRGYPILRFVEENPPEGTYPDFRIMSSTHFARCVRHHVCWVCGGPLGAYKAFVVGPMCCVNTISSEPPCHLDCARYSVQVCPFLSIPQAKRREAGMPDDTKEVGGIMIRRNPGVIAIWITKTYELMAVPNGVIIIMGQPTALEFWTRGRPATRAEVDEAVTEGFPSLLAVAEQQGPEALRELARQREAFDARLDGFLPQATNSGSYKLDMDPPFQGV